MATKKSNQAAPEGAGQNIQELTAASAAEQEKASAAASRNASDGASGEGSADRSGPATREEGTAAPEYQNKNGGAELQSLDELALLFRVPTWQQAALTRLMGWAPDKSVSEADYADALEALNSRRMGGGRKE